MNKIASNFLLYTSLLVTPVAIQSCDNNKDGHIKGKGFLSNEIIVDARPADHNSSNINTIIKLKQDYNIRDIVNDINSKTGYKRISGEFGAFLDSIPGVPSADTSASSPFYFEGPMTITVKDTTIKESYGSSPSKFK